jgi:hypothetical protein
MKRQVSLGEKIASMSGQDLRTPFSGGTKFPTDDSKQPIAERLEQNQQVAEAGPAPAPQLKPVAPTFKEVAVKMPSAKGSLPDIGQGKIAMAIRNDPLVQFLKKEAEQLDTNIEDLLKQHLPEPEVAEPPQASVQFSQRALDQQDDVLDQLFGAYSRGRSGE